MITLFLNWSCIAIPDIRKQTGDKHVRKVYHRRPLSPEGDWVAALVIVKRVAKEKVVTFKTADWATLKERMAAQNFQGEVVASELVDEHLAEVEKLTENTQAVESVPEEVELPDTVE